jgi:hypothetical protein
VTCTTKGTPFTQKGSLQRGPAVEPSWFGNVGYINYFSLALSFGSGVGDVVGGRLLRGGGEARMKKEGDMLESVLWRAHEIQARVAELGQAISEDFDGRPLVILGVTTLCPLFFPSKLFRVCGRKKSFANQL